MSENKQAGGAAIAFEVAGSSGLNLLDQLLLMVDRRAFPEGRNPTIIPFLSIYKHSRPTMLTQSVLAPSFCLILQGTKKLYLGEEIIYYGAGDYLASLIDMSASGQTVSAQEKSPYIGLRIDLSMQEIASVIMEAGIHVKLKNKKWSRAQQSEGIGKAITWIRENYTHSFTVAELAKMCNMSVSGLHHKFNMGPLQYQKSLRLQEARRPMLSGATDATTAAREVGYESPTQFNREYRRVFGLPPLKDIHEIRNNT
ncbi:AraC family transcriptional regulator [Paenibacillus sp. P96]|uniref:AraC family transcriptional regulator n=1 Tax=Paenibacillus zeirhizosphaerae TaxID=2987519 RepID=A0ABT9FSS4_9BACL|nr:AraC family transcriptional regulator [Paenibacillus sp. P96]MDP4097791.1 AraC family transcriptional regulator [Paenibacillus sp. P96]